MGRQRRARPARLAAKLRQIRISLGLTQEQMFYRLGDTRTPLYPGHIGEFETGRREPSLLVLLAYARTISRTGGGEFLEAMLADELELPDELPANPQEAVNRRSLSPTGRRRSKNVAPRNIKPKG